MRKRASTRLNFPDGLPINEDKNSKEKSGSSSSSSDDIDESVEKGAVEPSPSPPALTHHKRPASLMNYPDGLPIDDKDYHAIMNLKKKRSLYSNNTTGYRGVYKIGKKFAASVKIGRTLKHLCLYDTPKEAAVAYDQAVIQLKLPSIRLNFPNDYDYTSSSDEKSGESSSSESCQSEYSVGQFVSCMYNKQWSTVQITGVCADFTYNIQWEEFDDDNDYNVNEKELRLIVTSEEEDDDDDL